MEFNKILEIVENVVRANPEKADKLNGYMTFDGAKMDSVKGPELLAHFIQNNPEIHNRILNILGNKNKLKNLTDITLENKPVPEEKGELNKFIELNLSHQQAKNKKEWQSPQKKDSKNGIKGGQRKNGRRPQ
jgi:hypothetical protein